MVSVGASSVHGGVTVNTISEDPTVSRESVLDVEHETENSDALTRDGTNSSGKVNPPPTQNVTFNKSPRVDKITLRIAHGVENSKSSVNSIRGREPLM